MKIFCIIPALNEEGTIKEVIEKTKLLVEQVVVIDDGSTDNTKKIAKEAGAIVLTHLINRGQGASLETGNSYALSNGADAVFHFDADGQFMTSEIKDVLEPIIKNEVDVVLGSRFMGKKSNMPWFKKFFIIPIAHLVNRFVLGTKIDLTDPQCGFRAMNREALKKIKIEQNGMAHTSEILYKIYKNNLRIKEVPITVVYNQFGQSIFSEARGGGGIRVLKDLILNKLMD